MPKKEGAELDTDTPEFCVKKGLDIEVTNEKLNFPSHSFTI